MRIFLEGVQNLGQSGQHDSKNKARRDARGMRKQNQRYKMRRDYLKHLLIQNNMFPANIDDENPFFLIDPYEMRAKGLDKSLTKFEFGRALFHINQRRGFKSNRKTDSSEDSKIYKTKDGFLAGFQPLRSKFSVSTFKFLIML